MIYKDLQVFCSHPLLGTNHFIFCIKKASFLNWVREVTVYIFWFQY